MTPESQAPQAPSSLLAEQKRKRRNRLILMAVVYGVLIAQAVASGRSTDFGLTVLGGGLGALAGMQLSQLVARLLGRLGGTAPTLLLIGSGPLLAVRRIGPVPVLVRPIPLLPLQILHNLVAVPALRTRLFLGGLCRLGVLVGLGAWLVATGDSRFVTSLGGGLLLWALLTLIMVKQRGSVGWMIFRAPAEGRASVSALALDRTELAAQRALMGARFDEARAALPGISAERPVRARFEAAVAIADGRYREALDSLRRARSEAEVAEGGGELLLARAALFGLEAGEIPREEAMAIVADASGRLGARMPRLLAACELLATEALLNGRAADALLLTRDGLRRGTDLSTRAFLLCTRAAAQAVTGEQAAARATLARARALAPDLARVAAVERLITQLPLTRDRV